MCKGVLLFIFIITLNVANYAQSDWKLHRTLGDIEVFFRLSDGNQFRELQIKTKVKASLATIVGVLKDYENYHEWVYKCKRGETIESVSPTTSYYRGLTDLSWPLKNREFVMRGTIYQDSTSLAVSFYSNAVPNKTPKKKEYLRIEETISNWELIPDKNGEVTIYYYLKINPRGFIPFFAFNFILDDCAIKNIQNLEKQLLKKRYLDLSFSFIEEVVK